MTVASRGRKRSGARLPHGTNEKAPRFLNRRACLTASIPRSGTAIAMQDAISSAAAGDHGPTGKGVRLRALGRSLRPALLPPNPDIGTPYREDRHADARNRPGGGNSLLELARGAISVRTTALVGESRNRAAQRHKRECRNINHQAWTDHETLLNDSRVS